MIFWTRSTARSRWKENSFVTRGLVRRKQDWSIVKTNFFQKHTLFFNIWEYTHANYLLSRIFLNTKWYYFVKNCAEKHGLCGTRFWSICHFLPSRLTLLPPTKAAAQVEVAIFPKPRIFPFFRPLIYFLFQWFSNFFYLSRCDDQKCPQPAVERKNYKPPPKAQTVGSVDFYVSSHTWPLLIPGEFVIRPVCFSSGISKHWV